MSPRANKPATPPARKLAAALAALAALGACGTDAREEAITTYLEAAPDCGEEAARALYRNVVDPMGRSEDEATQFIVEGERAEGCTPQRVPDFELAQLSEAGETTRYDVRFSEPVDDLYFFDADFERCFEQLYDTEGLRRFQLVTVETDEGPKIDLNLSKAPQCR